MTKTIQHQLFFPHPPQLVWDYITEPELMEQWLMKNDFVPLLGCDFSFRTNPIPALNFDGIFHCKVVEIAPFKKLSYSMKAGPGEGKIELDSIVVWTLEEKDKGTQLSLVHSGFRELEDFNIFTGMNDGWKKNMQKILDQLNAKYGNPNA